MKDTIYESKFCNEMAQYYSYDGAKALFNFLEECDPDMEFDPIAICCDFQEFDNFNDFKSDWGSDIETIEELQNNTTVLKIPESDKFVIQQF